MSLKLRLVHTQLANAHGHHLPASRADLCPNQIEVDCRRYHCHGLVELIAVTTAKNELEDVEGSHITMSEDEKRCSGVALHPPHAGEL